MATPLKAYQTLYASTSKLLKSYSQDTETGRLYFGILCKNFATLTLPSGSGSLADADTYSDSGNKTSSFYVAELAKLVTLSQSIFVNEVVINPSGCNFFVSNGFINAGADSLNISWFPNPLYQSYKICLQVNHDVSHGINYDAGPTDEITFGSINQYTGFDREIALENVTSRDLISNNDLLGLSNITRIDVYLFGYSGVEQSGTRSNIPSIRGSILSNDSKMYFDITSTKITANSNYVYNITKQIDDGTGVIPSLGFITGG
jgi:hypothetical protein